MEEECSFSSAMPSIEKLVTCIVVMLSISLVRTLAGLIVTKKYHRPLPVTLKFPGMFKRHIVPKLRSDDTVC